MGTANGHPVNVAERLRLAAGRVPDQPAVIVSAGRGRSERRITFAELDGLCDRLASGLIGIGVRPGERIVLLVRPGVDFIALVFALFRAGATLVLIDPGMGFSRASRCLAEIDPDGFITVPIAQLLRRFGPVRFRRARHNVCVGRPRTGGLSYAALAASDTQVALPEVAESDPAAIIFTSGGTGPPKGVLYEHGMFAAQVDLLREEFDIAPGGADLSGFPLFALFNAALCVTTVLPRIDFTRPGQADPRTILRTIETYQVNQAFASPALWDRLGRHCQRGDLTIPHLRRVFSAGAPVPLPVLERMTQSLAKPDAKMHTPYGATEALPVATLDAATILDQTAQKSRRGAGTCVGRPVRGVAVRIIERTDRPIETISQAALLPAGEVGEIIVQSPSATRTYCQHPEATALAKIAYCDGDGKNFWHRMGDVGYLDGDGRLWICGRKVHVVETTDGPLFPVCCEAVFNEHPRVFRSALVGIGEKPAQRPAIVVELERSEKLRGEPMRNVFLCQLYKLGQANPLTQQIETFFVHPGFPVDVRHNIKIDRTALASWARVQLKKGRRMSNVADYLRSGRPEGDRG